MKIPKLPSELCHYRVLVAEDNEDLLQFLREGLEYLGLTHIDTATNGLSAQAKIQENWEAESVCPYDLLITDYFMPMLSGTSLIEFVRGTEFSKEMKVLMITAHAMALSDETLRRLGVEKVLLKPVTLAVLGETVQEILRKIENEKE